MNGSNGPETPILSALRNRIDSFIFSLLSIDRDQSEKRVLTRLSQLYILPVSILYLSILLFFVADFISDYKIPETVFGGVLVAIGSFIFAISDIIDTLSEEEDLNYQVEWTPLQDLVYRVTGMFLLGIGFLSQAILPLILGLIPGSFTTLGTIHILMFAGVGLLVQLNKRELFRMSIFSIAIILATISIAIIFSVAVAALTLIIVTVLLYIIIIYISIDPLISSVYRVLESIQKRQASSGADATQNSYIEQEDDKNQHK
jgi:hypothetical protein